MPSGPEQSSGCVSRRSPSPCSSSARGRSGPREAPGSSRGRPTGGGAGGASRRRWRDRPRQRRAGRGRRRDRRGAPAGRLPAAGRRPGHRRGRAAPAAPSETRRWKRSTWRPGSATGSRCWSPSWVPEEPPAVAAGAGGEEGADQPRQRHGRTARNDRRHRAGDRRRHPRVPRPAWRPLFGRPARPGAGHRAGDDGGAARPPPALSGGALRTSRPAGAGRAIVVLVALGLAHAGEIRGRAEAGAGQGMPAREAALARGFVLGEDEGVDAATREDFRRAGLSHLLAVSGQNVALLALLAMPVLAAFGISLRARLVWVLGLIAVYVPLAGAGPSIQRAGGDGRAGRLRDARRTSLLAPLRPLPGRRRHPCGRPAVAADVGWQLSFAAVLGILAAGRAAARRRSPSGSAAGRSAGRWPRGRR